MDSWPSSTSVSAAAIAANHGKRLIQIAIMLVVVVVGPAVIGSFYQVDWLGSIAFVAFVLLVLAGVANFQISRTAKLVAADLASHPGATGWRMQLGLNSGRRLKSDIACFLVSDGADYRVYLNGKVLERGALTHVQDGDTARTDYRVAEGPRAGQSYEQISTIRDDILLSCAGAPGGPRPDGFSCTPGSGRTLSVWTRVV